jgi:hypothetical protein
VVLMAADPLEQVLALVAEGRLTAEEAGPILAALDERPGATARPDATRGAGADAGPWPGDARTAAPGDEPPGGFGFNPPPSFDRPSASATSLRLEVRENGRQVVNLRLPIAVGRLALDRVPGLSGEQVERVREAMSSGMRGPILQVEDGDSGVRIVLE